MGAATTVKPESLPPNAGYWILALHIGIWNRETYYYAVDFLVLDQLQVSIAIP